MFPSTGGRRLGLLIRRAAAAAATAGCSNALQPQPDAAGLYHLFTSPRFLRNPNPEPCPTASYLVASCGLSPASAAAASLRMRICSTAKADAVLAVLRRHGFSDADVARMLRTVPQVLLLDPEKILRPKLEFFAVAGVPADVLSRTGILSRSLDKHILPCFTFLRGIIGTDGDICRVICRNPRALLVDPEKKMRPAVDALRRLGLPEKAISKLIVTHSSVLMISPDRIGEIFEDLKALGLGVMDTAFLYGIRALCGVTKEKWLRRIALYRSFGVSEGELRKAFKTHPNILQYSDDSIKKKLRFFLDELKLEVSYVIAQPVLIGYSLEKKIIPRCAVLSVLMREGKIEPDIKLPNALLGNSKDFSERYVLRYADDVPDVVKAYEGKIKFEGFRDGDKLQIF